MDKPRGRFTTIKVLGAFLAVLFALSGCGKSEGLVLSGTVEAEQIDVNSEVSGKVIKLEKEEGNLINKNETIAVVDSSMQELAVKQQEAVVSLKQAKLDELKAGTRPEQIEQAQAAVEAAKTGLNTAKTGVDTAQISYNYWQDKYNKTKSLLDSSAVSENDLADAKYKLDTAQQQLITAEKQYNSAQSQLKSAQAQLDLLRNGSTYQTIKAAEADLEQSKEALEQAKLVLSKYNIKSPITGTYLSKNINLGDIVSVGSSVATVADLNNLWLRVYIPQRNLHQVKLNQEVNLTVSSMPGKTIKGKIIYIADEAEFTPKNTETTEAKENTVFKLKIKIMDHIDTLKPGMPMEARIE
ncbi:MAG: efflux RND transporter periplasmic adaptor subunit [Clostridiales bacterium]|nr:efflux RND transporter periplasmic adaptor subunit [Eubacteriales bacterium]MDH7565532.1 efflux RND transporter periplasmic adaptor subunit [Clostridiales bacterium]